jgi:hypothetical protein
VKQESKDQTKATRKFYSKGPDYTKYKAKIMDDRHTSKRRSSKTVTKPTEYAIYRNDKDGKRNTIKKGEEIRVSYSRERNKKEDENTANNRWTRQRYELKDECMILDTYTGLFKPHTLTPENICTTVREHNASMAGPFKPKSNEDRTYCPKCERSHDNDTNRN